MIYYPPEWQEHKSTWFSFPHNSKEWNPKRLEKIQDWFINLYEKVLDYEDLDLIFSSKELLETNQSKLNQLKNKKYDLRTHIIPNNDIWIRDYGPFFVKENGKTQILDFGFNAWGGKFPPWDLDNQVPKEISKILSYSRKSFNMILEGGSVEFNGAGILMTSKQCLLNPNRNPNLNQTQIEKILIEEFNLEKVVWLNQGLEGDHTDGHIDDFARFLSEDTVMLCKSEKDDINFDRLQENKNILKNTGLKIIEIPLPIKMAIDGERLPNSYANFIFLNNAIIVPIFNCSYDTEALSIFKEQFPNREIISLDSCLLIEEGGGLHCASKQEPR